MFGIINESDDDINENIPWSHKDLGSSRIKWDEEDLQKIQEEFQRFNVFSTLSSKVVSITTGVMLPLMIYHKLYKMHRCW